MKIDLMYRNIIPLLLFTILYSGVYSQESARHDFSIRLEQEEIKEFPALQSYAIATWKGKWLLLGGRTDGLHRRQPWASFDDDGQNRFMYVIDPTSRMVWKQSLLHFPKSMQEQLRSTNMQHYQDGNNLILTGGYGYSEIMDDHITYPYLTILKIEETITSIISGRPDPSNALQIKDQRMAVTGGGLGKSGDTLILAGGQRFDGMYNPHGPDHGPGFTQEYTNEIRQFILDTNIPSIKWYGEIRDSINLHRRDYNLVPQIFENGEAGYTMYSGVFQYDEDLPFTNFVDIKNGSYRVNNLFEQKLSHYHTAVLPIYDETASVMYSIFFGGIAQFYISNKKIVENKEVPFTKTISVIKRRAGTTEETWLPVQMPGYLGTGAEFIFADNINLHKDGIAGFSQFSEKETLVGYIVGGINSSAKNIFFSNSGKESKANNSVIRVYLKR